MVTRVLGIGDNTIDIYVDHGLQFPGGNAVNVAVLTRRLGASSSYLGCVGRDARGDILRQALAMEGVDTSRIRLMDRPTSWSRIRHEGAERQFAGSQNNQEGCYRLTPDDFAFIGGHDIVHSSIYSRLEDEIARIGAASRAFSFDYSADFDDAYLERTAPHVDIAFLSVQDASRDDCQALCRRVAAYGPSCVVVTRGPDGSVAFEDGAFHAAPSIAVEPVDTLGAGDGFIAAFLMARQRPVDVAGALAEAASYAAKVCSYFGAFGHQSDVAPRQPGHRAGDNGSPTRTTPEPRRNMA